LPDPIKDLIHGGLDVGHIGLALAEPVIQRAEGGIGQRSATRGTASAVPAAWARRKLMA
jgi:hypothetical protein